MYLKAVPSRLVRLADENAGKLYGIGEEILIENAASALYDECPKVKSAVILAGPGNNGADGFALARRLFLSGCDTEILTLCDAGHKNAEIAKKLGIKIYDFYDREEKEAELYVDALFGTGLSRPVTGKAEEMIEYMNSKQGIKIAVDVPSGADADTGAVRGCAVRADKTVTFAFAKPGLYQFPCADYAGKVVVKDIFLPDTIGDTKRYIVKSASIPKREKNTHKGTYGRLLCMTGSESMTGAAYMSAQAAIKSGCGLVTVLVPDVIGGQVSSKLTEAMVMPCPSKDGAFSKEAFTAREKYFSEADTLLIGCGIRNTEETAYLVREAVSKFIGKKVIDADGLNVLAGTPELLAGAVITPHPGEMARLMKTDIASVEMDRVQNAVSFSVKYGCTVVLKGARTVTAYPDGRAYINDGGNPGMANGGSGDVLAGLIASFLAQGIPDAEIAAVYIHSLAGFLAAEKYSENAMSATDLIKMIPKAIKSSYGV